MSEDEKMLIDERYKYLRLMHRRYAKANRRERQALLDEMEAMTGCHRKSLIRHMKGVPKREKRGRQRGRVYGAEVEDALRVIAPSFDYLCAERMQPNLEWMASQLEKHGELEVSEGLRAQLRYVSIIMVHLAGEFRVETMAGISLQLSRSRGTGACLRGRSLAI